MKNHDFDGVFLSKCFALFFVVIGCTFPMLSINFIEALVPEDIKITFGKII
jgi:hypothetical protein